jgi:hypothetical protein
LQHFYTTLQLTENRPHACRAFPHWTDEPSDPDGEGAVLAGEKMRRWICPPGAQNYANIATLFVPDRKLGIWIPIAAPFAGGPEQTAGTGYFDSALHV